MNTVQLRAAGVIGVAAAICFVIAFLVDPTPPTAGADPAAVVAHIKAFTVNDRIAGFLFAGSGALLVAFAAGLREVLFAHATRAGWLATAMLAGAIHAGTMLTIISVIFFTLGAAATSFDQQSAGVLSNIANYGFIFAGFGTLVFIAFGTALMLSARGALRVLGEIGLIASAAMLVYLSTAFFTTGPFTAGGVVSITCFSIASLWVTLTALALLTLEPHALIGPDAPIRARRARIRS
ncbi:MAG: hypothetical protein ABR498_05540 [Candidatus Dormibacteria bacterium]